MFSDLFEQMQIFPKKPLFSQAQSKRRLAYSSARSQRQKKKKREKKIYIYTELKTDFQITISLDHCLVALANDKYS